MSDQMTSFFSGLIGTCGTSLGAGEEAFAGRDSLPLELRFGPLKAGRGTRRVEGVDGGGANAPSASDVSASPFLCSSKFERAVREFGVEGATFSGGFGVGLSAPIFSWSVVTPLE